MLSICLEEGLSNARKYRELDSMIYLRSAVEEVPPGAEIDAGSRSTSPPVLHVELDNLNPSGVAPLSEEQCSRIFEEGYKAHTSLVSSTGIGLDTIAKAITAAGGTAAMSVLCDAPDGTHTILHLWLPVEAAEESILAAVATEEPDAPAAEDQPPPESNVFVPASAVAAAAVPDTRVPGPTEEAALVGGAPMSDEAASPRPLVCAALDDSMMSRLLYKVLFDTMLNADPQRSCTLGETEEEQLSFVDVALGRKSATLQEMTPPLPAADIVMLDQNILLDDHPHLLGSDIAAKLCEASFRGVVCIMTGSSRHELERLAQMPGVDLVLEKGKPLPDIARQLRAAYDMKAPRFTV